MNESTNRSEEEAFEEAAAGGDRVPTPQESAHDAQDVGQHQEQQQQQQHYARNDQEGSGGAQDEYHDGMIVQEELNLGPGNEERRREFRRRMTLDPLVDLLVDEVFLDRGGGAGSNAENQGGQEEDDREDGGSDGVASDANDDDNGSGAEAAGSENDNDEDLELLGILGRYAARNLPEDESTASSSDGEGGNEEHDGRGNDVSDPPQPAKNHSYLPTPQPLFPEEWLPAGRHRHRSRGESFADDDVIYDSVDSRPSEGVVDDTSSESEPVSSSHYSIPEPPDPFHSHSMKSTVGSTSDCLEAVAVLELNNDGVLFPGNPLPLRLHDRSWVNYLGPLIDDARGLYGSHEGTMGGMGEVRFVILPRVAEGTRRTRRRPREAGGRTGRWQVALIRRGLTGARRLRRRRSAENAGTDTGDGAVGNEPIRSAQNANIEPASNDESSSQRPNRPASEQSSNDSSEDDLFHPITTPIISDDPLVGRIGTMATITFTHEEVALSADRSSSAVWGDRGGELVLTVLGTDRVRLIHSVKNDEAMRRKHPEIPMYVVEKVHDKSVLLPPVSLIQPSKSFRCPIATRAASVRGDGREPIESGFGVYGGGHESAIQTLSLRCATPAIAYKAVWPWWICEKICLLIQESDECAGLRKILPSAAGLRHDQIEGALDNSDEEAALQPIRFQITDPPAFASWLGSNFLVTHQDKIDLLEMNCTVEQLRFILQKLEDTKQEAVLRCKHCGAGISKIRHVFSVGGSEGTCGSYVNEHGIVHQTLTLRAVDGQSVICIGRPETKDSWFPGYSWQIAYCSICSEHLGWKFRKVIKESQDDPDRPRSFWGFSSLTTDEIVQPRRIPLSFRTRRALAALMQG